MWFAKELFRALNEAADPDLTERSVRKRQALYHEAGIENDRDLLVAATCATQRAVNAGELSYNQAVRALYGAGTPWERASSFQRAALPELDEQHAANEEAACRAVGLVIETRPDAGLVRKPLVRAQAGLHENPDGRAEPWTRASCA